MFPKYITSSRQRKQSEEVTSILSAKYLIRSLYSFLKWFLLFFLVLDLSIYFCVQKVSTKSVDHAFTRPSFIGSNGNTKLFTDTGTIATGFLNEFNNLSAIWRWHHSYPDRVCFFLSNKRAASGMPGVWLNWRIPILSGGIIILKAIAFSSVE